MNWICRLGRYLMGHQVKQRARLVKQSAPSSETYWPVSWNNFPHLVKQFSPSGQLGRIPVCSIWQNRLPCLVKQGSRLVKQSGCLVNQRAPFGETECPDLWNRFTNLVKQSASSGETVCPVCWNRLPCLVKHFVSSSETVDLVWWKLVSPCGAAECPLWCSVMNGWRRKCKEKIRSWLINEFVGDKLMLTYWNIRTLKKFYITSTYFLAKNPCQLDS